MSLSPAHLRVAVNLLWLAPGRVGGSEQYLVRQLSGLADQSIDPVVFCQPAFSDAHPELASKLAVVVGPLRRDRRVTRIMAEHTWLAARTRAVDVVHHGGGTTPVVGKRPIVLTVHDLQYLRYPEYFGRGRRAYLDRMMPRSVERAAIVTVPSAYVRRRVVEAFGIDPEKVLVVPHGVPDLAPPSADQVTSTLARYGLDGGRPFVVYPAITHPHKGHLLLIDMLADLDTDVALVLIGGAGAAEAEIEQAIAGIADASRVVRTGRVSDLDRDVLVSAAAALVFPSEYEGFGAPLVEAMVFDTPVVCSAAEAVVEVAGGAAVVVAEPTPEAWANGVLEALANPRTLIERGRSRRQAFTLEICGRALADAYRLAAGS